MSNAISLLPIKSDVISKAGYDPTTQTLRLAFWQGGVYDYANVTPDLWAAFQAAPSKGAYFHAHLKQRDRHPATKV